MTKKETKGTVKKMKKENKSLVGKIMHFFAFSVIVYVFIEWALQSGNLEYSTHQTVFALWQIKRVLLAIFFEMVALNCK